MSPLSCSPATVLSLKMWVILEVPTFHSPSLWLAVMAGAWSWCNITCFNFQIYIFWSNGGGKGAGIQKERRGTCCFSQLLPAASGRCPGTGKQINFEKGIQLSWVWAPGTLGMLDQLLAIWEQVTGQGERWSVLECSLQQTDERGNVWPFWQEATTCGWHQEAQLGRVGSNNESAPVPGSSRF